MNCEIYWVNILSEFVTVYGPCMIVKKAPFCYNSLKQTPKNIVRVSSSRTTFKFKKFDQFGHSLT